MKKFLIAVVCICFLATLGFADGFDLSSMSDSELFDLRQAIEHELDSRGLWEGDPIGNGTYIVGKDIRPGKFTIRCVDIDEGQKWLGIGIYMNDEIKWVAGYNLNVGETVFINLEEGTHVNISNGNALIYPEENVYSWMP